MSPLRLLQCIQANPFLLPSATQQQVLRPQKFKIQNYRSNFLPPFHVKGQAPLLNLLFETGFTSKGFTLYTFMQANLIRTARSLLRAPLLSPVFPSSHIFKPIPLFGHVHFCTSYFAFEIWHRVIESLYPSDLVSVQFATSLSSITERATSPTSLI